MNVSAPHFKGLEVCSTLDAEQLFLQRSDYFHHLLYHSHVCTTPFVCFTYSTGRSACPERVVGVRRNR